MNIGVDGTLTDPSSILRDRRRRRVALRPFSCSPTRACAIVGCMEVSLRPARDDDREFLFKLYASTRLAELAPFAWSQAQQETFLRMQFNAQRGWYAAAYA